MALISGVRIASVSAATVIMGPGHGRASVNNCCRHNPSSPIFFESAAIV